MKVETHLQPDLSVVRADRGYTVFVAANAEEALTLFERHPSIDVCSPTS